MKLRKRIDKAQRSLRNWIQSVFHIFAGLITPLSYWASPFEETVWLFPIISFVLFLIYEYTQWLDKDDCPEKEMREYGYGFFSTTLALIVLRIILYLELISL